MRPSLLLAAACGLLLSLPFWTSRYVPLVDLPQHLALAAILRHHGDAAWGFARFYAVEWGELTPYWTYYLLLDGLAWLMPLETASRVVLSLYALALPLVGVRLCQVLGAPAWAGLLMSPLALNANLYFGFVAYVLGVVLMLWTMAEYATWRRAPSVIRGIVIAALAGVVFFTHAQAFAFLLAAVVVITGLPRTWRGARGLLLFAPATLALFLPWTYRQFVGTRSDVRGRYNFGTLDDLGARHRPLTQAVAELPSAVAGSFQDGTDTALLAAWAVVLVVLVLAGWRRTRGVPDPSRARNLLLCGLALAGYFAAPLAIRGQWNIAPRFAWLAALLAATLVRDPGPALARAGQGLAVALTVVMSLDAAWQHRRFDVEAAGFTTVADAIPSGQRVLSLVHHPASAVVTRWPYLHFGQYVLARRGGAQGRSLAKSPPFPVRHHQPRDFPAPDVFRPQDFRADAHGPHYDVLLLRGGPDASTLFAGWNGAPPLLIREAGGWRAWRLTAPAAR